MTRPTHHQQSDAADTLETATDWFARKRSGRMTAAESEAMERWLAESPLHREAIDKAEWMWIGAGMDAVRSHPRVLALRERAKAPAWKRFGLRAVLPAAAMVAAVIGAGALFQQAQPLSPAVLGPGIKQEFRTSVGQRTTVQLPDGSVVTLDTDTVLRTRETAEQRFVELQKGQAFFKVAKDPKRPFVVSAGGRSVTALGTAFSVKLQDKAFEVVLVEGKVRVDAPVRATPLALPTGRVQSTEMEAGSELAAADTRHWTVREVDGARETAWTEGRLVYQGRPLSEVVADMNRYSERKIVLADKDLGAQPLSGTYRAGDVEGFVRALQDYGLARVVSQDLDEVELGAF